MHTLPCGSEQQSRLATGQGVSQTNRKKRAREKTTRRGFVVKSS